MTTPSARMLRFTRSLDSAIAAMREGIARGVVQPKSIVERMIVQVQTFANGDPDAGLFMAPLKTMPERIAGTERARIEGAYREAVEGQLVPGYRRLLEFLKAEYLPHARDSIGLSAIPGGKDMYLYLVRSETTSDLTLDAIHRLGLDDLARIEADMERVKTEAGFSGSLAGFRDFLRDDPRFKFKDRAAMLAQFNGAKTIVDAHLDRLFITTRRQNSFSAFMNPMSRPIVRRRNMRPLRRTDGARAWFLSTRPISIHAPPTPARCWLRMKEFPAITCRWPSPGKTARCRASGASERKPPLRKAGRFMPRRWGRNSDSMPIRTRNSGRFLSMPGAPAGSWWTPAFIGWDGRAIRRFASSPPMAGLSEIEASEEVDRYTAIPAQALSYKIGEREILDLRERARLALGAKFDIRRFHEAVLKDGAMPLPVLDAKIARWIASEKSP